MGKSPVSYKRTTFPLEAHANAAEVPQNLYRSGGDEVNITQTNDLGLNLKILSLRRSWLPAENESADLVYKVQINSVYVVGRYLKHSRQF